MELITNWFRRHFSNPQVVFLALFLGILFLIVVVMGKMVAPILIAIVIAYLLEGLVRALESRGVPRLLAVVAVVVAFLVFVVLVLFGLVPLVSTQSTQLVQQIPLMLMKGQTALQQLPDNYPDIISIEQVAEMVSAVRMEITSLGQRALSLSISSVVGALTILVYLVIVPILIFFFLKDKRIIVAWIGRFVPSESQFAEQVWVDVDRQIGNYVRGKFWEIIIVWLVCVVVFSFLGLDYAMLLAVCVGLSVLIPYVGAAVVTVPVVLVAWFQWGWSGDLMWVVIAYLIIQLLDGNVLVPLLFSEVTDLHPVAIITAVLIFGGIWGVLGVFFSIPLATVVQAILSAWPVVDKPLTNTSAKL